MWRLAASFSLLLATLLPLTGSSAQQRGGAQLSIACGALGMELTLCREGAQAWARETGNSVQIVNTPNSSSDRFSLYIQLLSSQSADIDVMQIDVVWTGMLESHLANLDEALGERMDRVFPALASNNRVKGRLVAMPWYIDAGVLFYRKDLLAKYGFDEPETWNDLTRIARTIQQGERESGNARMWGYVFQAKAYEGLTCNALEWVSSYGGGTFLNRDRDMTAQNPRAIAALTRAGSWIGTIAPRGVLNYDEEAARGVFQTGNAVFMRNWPYAWALAQGDDSPIKDKVGVIALPHGPKGESAAALGGWQLAVSRYSRHRAEAIDLVKFLTSRQEQKRRAIKGAYNPTLTALYDDPDVIAANPFFATLYPVFEQAVPRPAAQAGARYSQVSNSIWRASYDVLKGDMDARSAMARLDDEVDRIAYRARWNRDAAKQGPQS